MNRIFSLVIVLVTVFALAQAEAFQILPNPNPVSSTITVDTYDAENFLDFLNYGQLGINSSGTLNKGNG